MAPNDGGPSGLDVFLRIYEADRQATSTKFTSVFEKLEEIAGDVRALRTEREVNRVTGGYIIPAALGVAGAWVARKLGL
jgi:hypothetical protein